MQPLAAIAGLEVPLIRINVLVMHNLGFRYGFLEAYKFEVNLILTKVFV